MDQEYSKAATKLAIRDYRNQFTKEWKLSFSSVLFSGLGNIFVFYAPALVIARLLQRFSTQSIPSLHTLIPYLVAFSGLWLLGEIFWFLTFNCLISAEARAIEDLNREALRRLLKKDLAFFHENFAGSLTKKTIAYAKSYEIVFDTIVFNISSNLIPLIFACFVLWQFSPLIAISLVAWTVAVAFAISPLIKRRRVLVDLREAASNKLSGYVADIYTNIDAIRTYAHEDFELSEHTSNSKDLARKAKRSWDYHLRRIDVVVSPVYVITNLLGVVLALWVAQRTGLRVEAVFITFTYYATFTRIMKDFNEIYRKIENGIAEAAQYTQLLLEEPLIKDPAHSQPFSVSDGRIDFTDMSFQYSDNVTSTLFEHFNLSINGGEKIGLVGHSGGGKSTLVKLVLRLMDIDDGSILIDGQDISKVKQKDLRKFIAYVPQDPVMFHRTIRENIAYGKLNATERQIKKVAEKGHAKEFIDSLPKKYETLIGERGIKLSGGQRQRVAIARAMLKDAPILLLDEATSALDSESEKLIQEALWSLMEDRTAIVIAHRLSTIQRMDRIVVLGDGKIIEQGTHQELLKNKATYAKLWAHQSGGFING